MSVHAPQGSPARRLLPQLAAALMLAILGLCLGGAGDARARASCPDEFNSPSQLSTFGARSSLFCLVNEERQANGLSALAPNRSLGLAAEHHSRAMDRRNFFGHEPDGSPASRARQAG